MNSQIFILDPKDSPFGINKQRYIIEDMIVNKELLKNTKKPDTVYLFSMKGKSNFPSKIFNKFQYLREEDFITSNSAMNPLERAIDISKQWHHYGKLPELLDIEGTNFGEIVQTRIANEIYELLKILDIASNIIVKIEPSHIRVQSNTYPIGRAFYSVASHYDIDCKYIEPSAYMSLKNCVSLMKRHKWWNDFHQCNLFSSGPLAKNNEYNILFDVPYINYYRCVSPVIDALSNLDNFHCWIYGKENFFEKSQSIVKMNVIKKSNAIKYLSRKNLIRQYIDEVLINDQEFKNIFSYNGIPFWEGIKNILLYTLTQEFTDYVIYQLQFQDIVHMINPKVHVIGSESRGDGVAGHSLLSKMIKIPIIEVQHGDFNINPVNYNPISDLICVGGKHYGDMLINIGIPQEKIVITGWPKFDRHIRIWEDNKKEKCDIINILFATQGIDTKLNFDCIRTITSYLCDHPDIRLIVKPHPMESYSTYENIARGNEKIIIKKPTDDVVPLLQISDVVILVSSTTGLEAALFGKPIICLNTVGADESIYVQNKLAIDVKNIDELIPAIEAILFNEQTMAKLAEARDGFIYRYTFKQDGEASKRVADEIIDSAHGGSSNLAG